MRISFFLCVIMTLILIDCSSIFSQNIIWTTTFGNQWDDGAYSIVKTNDGGLAFTGFQSTQYINDLLIMKLDSSGSQIWVKTTGGELNDRGHCIEQTIDGGFIICGMTEPSPQLFYALLLKIDGGGNILWQKIFNLGDDTRFHSVQQTSDGGYIVAGQAWLGSQYSGSYDMYIVKTDSMGNIEWQRTYEYNDNFAPGADVALSIKQLWDNGFIIGGFTQGSVWSSYLIRTDANGNTIWSKVYDTLNVTSCWDVIITSDNSFLLVGEKFSFETDTDVLIMKLDTNGNLIWQKVYGGVNSDRANSVRQLPDGGFIIAGQTGSFGSGQFDVYLLRTNSNGDLIWYKTFGGPYDDRGNSVEVVDDGIVLAGWSWSFGSGQGDAYIIKVNDPAFSVRIDSLSPQTITRSGRLKIYGKNFGSDTTDSYVLIDGKKAIISRWSNNKIVVYVPEQTGLGSVSVKVITKNGISNEINLNVTLRQPQGRVKWVFEADVANLWFRPALANDGTIYIHGSEGYVYALNPDGELKWIQKVNSYAYVPPAAGPGGELYVGSIKQVTAINPDGSIRWIFTDQGTQGIMCGPAIGPDGNIYLANDFGLGAYSLTPTGQLRWNNPGDPTLHWYGGIGVETVLGPRNPGEPISQMYIVSEPLGSYWTLQAFSINNGNQIFSVPISGQHDPLSQQQTQPAVGPDGTIYITHFRQNIGWVLEAYDPRNGQSLWYYQGGTISGLTPPDVSSDGIVYYTQDRSKLIAFNPNTLLPKWIYQDGTVLNFPTISPQNDVVLVGGVVNFGDVGFIKGISSNSGQLLWTVPLPGAFYPLPRVVPIHRPRFTPDGKIAYVSTIILSGSSEDPHSYLYAIIIEDTTTKVENTSLKPDDFKLYQNYPNPFNNSTNIVFEIPEKTNVKLSIYDALGRELENLINQELSIGKYSIRFEAKNYPSGVYFYKLETEKFKSLMKMILLK